MSPKRRFWQIHLSTAVVLMFVAGMLVWANVREYDPDGFSGLAPRWGWPFGCAGQIRVYPFEGSLVVATNLWWPKYIVFNSLIALAILLAVWQLCEWRIRRREARKE